MEKKTTVDIADIIDNETLHAMTLQSLAELWELQSRMVLLCEENLPKVALDQFSRLADLLNIIRRLACDNGNCTTPLKAGV